MKTIETVEDFRQYIESQMEPTALPDAVAEWAQRNAGKMLTARNVPAGVKIRKEYGMTQLVSDNYYNHKDGEDYYSFLLAHAEVHVEIPTVAVLRERNTAYYSGLEERNRKRMELINNRPALLKMFSAFRTLADASAAYKAAAQAFDALADYPKTPDYYGLRKLAGWIEEKR